MQITATRAGATSGRGQTSGGYGVGVCPGWGPLGVVAVVTIRYVRPDEDDAPHPMRTDSGRALCVGRTGCIPSGRSTRARRRERQCCRWRPAGTLDGVNSDDEQLPRGRVKGVPVHSVAWSAVYPVRCPHVVRGSRACGAQMVA
ncbi:hypothetical protein GCM10010345_74670 [Streptomyces canarius]|uniref:Uncharacterized protein n=1 Tax=Streptomyces canarius TaxID=285453 RepID=A0ABQ3DAL1_9ACTN|nr:hypothetical protein GCM10010345_74670 [Streptomyces canarius]